MSNFSTNLVYHLGYGIILAVTEFNLEGYHKEPLPLNRATFLAAVHDLVEDLRFGIVLGRFYYTYEYKKQFPWLPESGNYPSKENGLSCAIENALLTHRHKGQLTNPAGVTLIDQPKRVQLHEAFDLVSLHYFALHRFAHRLSPPKFILRGDMVPIKGQEQDWKGFIQLDPDPQPRWGLPKNPFDLTVAQMKKEIALSLNSYWQHHNQGLSNDPW